MAYSCFVTLKTSANVLVPVTLAAMSMCGCSAISPPVTETQVASFSARLSDELRTTIEPPSGPITMSDAVARAINYNHTVRAHELEVSLSEAKARAQGGALLPNIVAESDYYRQDRLQMSHSSGSPEFSTSSDIASISRNITLSWNILDFGLSFIRARQSVNKAHEQREEARRISSRITEETRSAFWKAVALEELAPGLKRLDAEVNAAMALAREAANDNRFDPMMAITIQRDVLNLQRELNQIHSSIAGAKDQLKQLIGLQDLPEVSLDHARKPGLSVLPATSADQDVATALIQRPEIRQHMYDMRITEDEIDATILKVLPGATFSNNFASDSNSYLLHSNWISWGTKITGNLINLVRLDADLEAVEEQGLVQRQSALATAATVVMQVHVARARLAVAQRTYRDAERFALLQRLFLKQVGVSLAAGKVGQQALTREKLSTLLAQVRAILAFADFQSASAAYSTAKGDDTDPNHGGVDSLPGLSSLLEPTRIVEVQQ